MLHGKCKHAYERMNLLSHLCSCVIAQTIVPEAGDRSKNICKDGVAPGGT